MICPKIFGILVLLALVQIVIVKSTLLIPPNPEDPKFTAQYLAQLKQPLIRSPYKKFGLAYDKFSVCELRYEQKISVCDAVLSSKKFRYRAVPQGNEYLDLSCRRRVVDLSELEKITNTKELSLSMYECPNPYKIESRHYKDTEDEVEFFIPIHFFVIGGYFRNSVVLSYRHAGSRPLPIKFHTVFLDVSLEELERLYFVQRNEIYEESTKLRKRATKPIIRRVVDKEGTIQRSHVEADAKALGKDLIRTTSIYSKFTSTYKIINICAMPKENKLRLCRQIFETSPYKLLVLELKTDEMFGCIRREVVLLHPFAQSASTKMASFRCPILKTLTTNLFFLASMHEIRGLIAFMQIPPFLKLLPDAVVTGLDSEGLLKKPALISTPGSKNKKPRLYDKLKVVNESV